jgi:hypothetical protein
MVEIGWYRVRPSSKIDIVREEKLMIPQCSRNFELEILETPLGVKPRFGIFHKFDSSNPLPPL